MAFIPGGAFERSHADMICSLVTILRVYINQSHWRFCPHGCYNTIDISNNR